MTGGMQPRRPRPQLTIDNRLLGEHRPALVVADLGLNHGGKLDAALRGVEAAWEAGADAVLMRLYRADRLLHPSATRHGEAAMAARLRAGELSDEAAERVVTAARQAGLTPLAMPGSPRDVGRVAELRLPAVRVASADLVNPLVLDAAAGLGVPMLVGTGAASEPEIEAAAVRLRERSAAFALLHGVGCAEDEATPDAEATVGRVGQLAQRFACVAGYADGCENLAAGALAVACGARVIEKRLAIDAGGSGLGPRALREYVYRLREAEQVLGVERTALPRRPASVELAARHGQRQSLVAARPIAAGEAVTRAALTCQRPGTGVPAAEVGRVCGMIAVRQVPAGALLDWADLDVAEGRRAA